MGTWNRNFMRQRAGCSLTTINLPIKPTSGCTTLITDSITTLFEETTASFLACIIVLATISLFVIYTALRYILHNRNVNNSSTGMEKLQICTGKLVSGRLYCARRDIIIMYSYTMNSPFLHEPLNQMTLLKAYNNNYNWSRASDGLFPFLK